MAERYRPPAPVLEGEILPAEAPVVPRGRPRISRPPQAEIVVKHRNNGGRTRGPLLNNRHERFAQALVSGKTAVEAYFFAGFGGSARNAKKSSSELYLSPHVQRRVLELQERAAEKVIISVPEVIKGLKKIASKTAATKNPLWADKLRALELLGRHLNMFKQEETKEVSVNIVIDAAEASY